MTDTLSARTGSQTPTLFKMTQEDGTIDYVDVPFADLSGVVEGEQAFMVIGYTDVFIRHGEWEGKPTKRNVRRWLFQVVGGEFDGQWVTFEFTNSLHPNSKFRPLVEAIIGRELSDDDEVDFADLLGRKVFMTVVSEKNARGYDNVYYRTARKHKAKAATATAAPPRRPAPATASADPDPGADDPFDGDDA